jgi:Zn-finger nucleic acid-binding protein
MFEVDYCPDCRGMWLDFDELDRLEDTAFDRDDHKGSLVHGGAATEFRCPHCGAPLSQFQYRLYDLNLDYCAGNLHGFWLDAGEDERVMAIMRQRAQDYLRKGNAENEWSGILRKFRSKSFWDVFK